MAIPYSFLIFLDFDGVLHRGTSGTFRKVPLLDSLLAANPRTGIVLTTNWRMSEDFDSLRAYFTNPVTASRIFDVVDDVPVTRHGQRQREIESWLDTHRYYGQFVALDDSASLFDTGWRHLVLTDAREGLTEGDIAEVAQRICRAGACH